MLGARAKAGLSLAGLALVGTATYLYAVGGDLGVALPQAKHAEDPAAAALARRSSTLSWMSNEALRCGEWPSPAIEAQFKKMGVDTDELGWQCTSSGSKKPVAMPTHGLSTPIKPEQCASWCESNFNASSAIEGKWCCQWTPSRAGGECSWSEGLALFTPTKCVQIQDKCVKPLAYEACSLAASFAPAASGSCQRGGRSSLGLYSAPTLNACSQLCASTTIAPGCVAFGFSAKEVGCQRSGCELLSDCRKDNAKSSSWDFYGKNKTDKPATGAMRAGAFNGSLDFEQADWPRQVGAPLGLTVNANREPLKQAPASVRGEHEHGSQPDYMRGVDPSTEFVCDTASGKKAADAMNIGGDWPNSCSQICLPMGFWGPAAKRGVTHGTCKANGCSVFVAARTYAGVPYNTYNCTCPTTNASAIYKCPAAPPAPSDGGSGGGGPPSPAYVC